jgi:hypothetical protein
VQSAYSWAVVVPILLAVLFGVPQLREGFFQGMQLALTAAFDEAFNSTALPTVTFPPPGADASELAMFWHNLRDNGVPVRVVGGPAWVAKAEWSPMSRLRSRLCALSPNVTDVVACTPHPSDPAHCTVFYFDFRSHMQRLVPVAVGV